VPNGFGYTTLAIQDNTFTDNWGGVVLWENSNRFCGDGSDGVCTLASPSVATMSSCKSGLANSSENQPGDPPDYFDLCRKPHRSPARSALPQRTGRAGGGLAASRTAR